MAHPVPLPASRRSCIFRLRPLNTSSCEHAAIRQGPVSASAGTFSFQLPAAVHAGYESGTATRFLRGRLSIVTPRLMVLSLEVFSSFFLPPKRQGGLASLSMKSERAAERALRLWFSCFLLFHFLTEEALSVFSEKDPLGPSSSMCGHRKSASPGAWEKYSALAPPQTCWSARAF